MSGKVYLVGAGPGNPEFITLRGYKLLKKCDVVIYDRLVSSQILSYVKEDCIKIYVGKDVGKHTFSQEEINEIIVENAKQYMAVVRLKGGDPFVFGRGSEEITRLIEEKIDYEIIPGLSSSISVPTYSGIPVTSRGISQSFHVITGHTASGEGNIAEDLKKLSGVDGTIVILMGVNNISEIKKHLIMYGKDINTPVAVISNGTTCKQKEIHSTLKAIEEDIANSKIKAPAIIIIGKCANLNFKSTIEYPLKNVSIGVASTSSFLNRFINEMYDYGAWIEPLLVSKLKVYEDSAEFEKALMSIEKYSWLVFTSVNSIDVFFEKMTSLKIDRRRLGKIKFAVVGDTTESTLMKYGFIADLKPDISTTQELAKLLINKANKTEHILISRAQQGSNSINEILEKENYNFDDIKTYDILPEVVDKKELDQKLSQINYLIFASASSVHSFFKADINEIKIPERVQVVCLGLQTIKALEKYGVKNIIKPQETSISGIVKLINNHYQIKKTL